MVITPFEKNLEVWKQLWRVTERSDVVVQVVDARNPLLYRSQDLEKCVLEVSDRMMEMHATYPGQVTKAVLGKRNLLVINKSDLLSEEQRQMWVDHFNAPVEEGGAGVIDFVFFSAYDEECRQKATADAERLIEAAKLEHDYVAPPAEGEEGYVAPEVVIDVNDVRISLNESLDSLGPLHICNREELMLQIRRRGQDFIDERGEGAAGAGNQGAGNELTGKQAYPLTVGMVGYPNVGKSSIINVIHQNKKVAVSATPGKTKHFQTLFVNDWLCVCDCPGLVQPTFMSSKADMVLSGVLPLTSLKDVSGPVELVTRRLPSRVFANLYNIPMPANQEFASALTLLHGYAGSRGYNTKLGRPDEHKAGIIVIKDYCAGKLLFAHAPPGCSPEKARAFRYKGVMSSLLVGREPVGEQDETEEGLEGEEGEEGAGGADSSSKTQLHGDGSTAADGASGTTGKGSRQMDMALSEQVLIGGITLGVQDNFIDQGVDVLVASGKGSLKQAKERNKINGRRSDGTRGSRKKDKAVLGDFEATGAPAALSAGRHGGTFTRPQYSITTPEGIGAAKLAAAEAKLAATRLERERKLALMQSKR